MKTDFEIMSEEFEQVVKFMAKANSHWRAKVAKFMNLEDFKFFVQIANEWELPDYIKIISEELGDRLKDLEVENKRLRVLWEKRYNNQKRKRR